MEHRDSYLEAIEREIKEEIPNCEVKNIKQEKTKQDWQKTKKYFDSYKIVD